MLAAALQELEKTCKKTQFSRPLSEGILNEGEGPDRVRRAIQQGLSGFADAETQSVAIHGVSRREEIYSGTYTADAPDLLVNYALGFRVSWQTALGAMPHALFVNRMRMRPRVVPLTVLPVSVSYTGSIVLGQ